MSDWFRAQGANERRDRCQFDIRFDEDGASVIRGRPPAEQGALIVKALELAMDRADVTAETSGNDSHACIEYGPHVPGETLRRIACVKLGDGSIRFRDARNRVLPDDATIEDWIVSRNEDFHIDADTCVPHWQAGNRIDWHMAVGAMISN